jgi:hypothetical protein
VAVFNTNVEHLLGRGQIENPFVQILLKVYGQGATTLFLAPHMGIRNLMQSMAFDPHFFSRLVSVMRNEYKLSEADAEFFATQVTQLSGITHELLYLQHSLFKNVPVLREVNIAAQSINMIAITDQINRRVTWTESMKKMHEVLDGFDLMKISTAEFNKLMKKIDFAQLTNQEQYQAEQILLLEGKDAFIRFISLQYTYKIHFAYDRYARSYIEQKGEASRLLFNLLTFPKSYTQTLLQDVKKLTSKEEQQLGAGTGTKISAVRSVLWRTTLGLLIANTIFQLITGKQRRPYDPFDLVLNYGMGGLALGIPDIVKSATTDMILLAITPEEDRSFSALEETAWNIRKIPRTFLPFFKETISAMEATLGKVYIDTTVIRQIMEMAGAEFADYKTEFQDATRTPEQSIKHALFSSNESLQKEAGRLIRRFRAGKISEFDYDDMLQKLEAFHMIGALSDSDYARLRKNLKSAWSAGIKKSEGF